MSLHLLLLLECYIVSIALLSCRMLTVLYFIKFVNDINHFVALSVYTIP